ncbi:MAG: cyclase family protein, partial [Planctomycetota bacterium]
MRTIDLTLPISNAMPGVSIDIAKRLEVEGWNATTLRLYSHVGTHMDAPYHFCPEGDTLERQDLSVCVGPARVIHMHPIAPSTLITVQHLGDAASEISAGDRLLFRTDWHKRYGTDAYRNQLPRISLDLARWLVDRRVGMIGVEPP